MPGRGMALVKALTPPRPKSAKAKKRGFAKDRELERVKGIEPSPKAWEAFVLPLNYTRERLRPRELAPRGRSQVEYLA